MATLTIADVVHQWQGEPVQDPQVLIERLIAREEAGVGHLREMGARLYAFPEFVAEAIAQSGLGEPISTEQRAYIGTQFTAKFAELEQFMRDHGHDH